MQGMKGIAIGVIVAIALVAIALVAMSQGASAQGVTVHPSYNDPGRPYVPLVCPDGQAYPAGHGRYRHHGCYVHWDNIQGYGGGRAITSSACPQGCSLYYLVSATELDRRRGRVLRHRY
jgi:hypothetical protein